MKLQHLRERMDTLRQQARSIVQAAEKENRDLTDDERKQVDELLDNLERTKADVKRAETLEGVDQELEQSSRRTAPGGRVYARDNRENDPKAGFESFGEYLQSVKAASFAGGQRDERLYIAAGAATTSGNESTGADGGFAVPTDFAGSIRSLALEEESFFAMADRFDVQGNSMRFPADETTPWDGSGIQMRWEAEGTAATQDKPQLKSKDLRLSKLIGLVPMTEELLEDTDAMDQYLQRKFSSQLRWKLNDALVNGTGAGQPLGVANANAQVTVTRNNANKIDSDDVLTMYARALPQSKANGVWIVNDDAWPQLTGVTIGDQPAFFGPGQNGAMSNAPGGVLLGRPVMISQTAETLGTQGDLRFVDWSNYLAIEKGTGPRMAQSMHLFFDADQQAFRMTFRADGQPWLSAPVDPNKGSNKLSHAIALK